MEEVFKIYNLNVPLKAKERLVEDTLTENFVNLLKYEELGALVKSSLNRFDLEVPNGEDVNVLVSQVIRLLLLYRRDELRKIILNLTKEVLSDELLDLEEIVLTLRKLIAIELIRKVISPLISQNMPALVRRIQPHSPLPVLFNLATVINEHEECLPPLQSHQQFCVDIINYVAQLKVPSSQRVEFMQAINEISLAVKKVWLSSPKSSAVLPCLVHIYTLMAGVQEFPSPTLASFLDVAPDSHIDIALDKLIGITGYSEDVHVKRVALTLCDWMIQWPKALRVSQWVIRLFRALTLDNRSSVVAEVIAEKASMLIEKSIVPVMRHSTAPVLPYVILTVRDQPLHKFEAILSSALRLFTFLKLQSRTDPSAAELRQELSDAFHILAEKVQPSAGAIQEILYTALKEYPKPSEIVVLQKLAFVPPLFGTRPLRETNGPIVLDNNWLSERTQTGKIGLINLGNTCYANAVVQALSMNQDFTRVVLAQNPSCGQVVLAKLQQVLGFLLCSFRAAYSPAVFIKTSRPPWFDVGRQQDCSEFLKYLIDTLYEQENAERPVAKCKKRWTVNGAKRHKPEVRESGVLNGDLCDTADVQEDEASVTGSLSDVDIPMARNESGHEEECSSVEEQRSLVHQIFGGKMTTVYRCLACGAESHHQDFFTDLHLAFPSHSDSLNSTPIIGELTVDRLLENYLLPEKLTGDNRYQCDACKKLVDEAERISRVDEPPMHLLLTLMRFCYDRENQRRSKIVSKVKHSRRIELPLSDGSTCSYVLYAVVVHSGITLDAGHYYTLGRSSDLCPEDITEREKSNVPWYLFNDSQVSRTDFDTLIGLSNKYPNDTPYLLWYRRVGDLDNACCVSDLPSLPPDLKRRIDEDNALFVRERLQHVARPPTVSWKSPPNDDDDQGDYQGDILQDNPGSRFVF